MTSGGAGGGIIAAAVGARLILAGKSEYIAGTQEAAAATKKLGDETVVAGKKAAASGVKWTALGKKVEAAGAKMSVVGKRMTHFITLPVLAAGAASVKAATDFSTSMMRIHTQAGGSIKDVRTLSKQVLALSASAQQGPVELADSLYHLKSVGMDNVSAMKALKQASDLAAVSGAGLEDTTNALAGAWRTGIPGAKNFHQTVSSLNAIVGAGNMKMGDLNAALGTGILPTAKTFGLTLKDVGTALALFTDEGTPANAAATRLRMTFSLLGAPTGRALKQLKRIHIGQYELATDMRGKNGLVRAVGDLKTHLDASGLSAVKQSALLSRAFGGGRSSSTILSMLNNYDVLEKKQVQVTKGTKRFGMAVKAQLKTPQAQFKLLISSLEKLGVEIGDKLLPYVLKATNWLNKMVGKFEELTPHTKKMIGMAILFAAALGPVVYIGGKMVSLIGFMIKTVGALIKVVGLLSKGLAFLAANPVVAVIVILVLVAAAIYMAYKRSKTFRDFVHAAFHDIAVAAKAVGNAGVWMYQHALKPAFHGVMIAIDFVRKHWKLFAAAFAYLLGGPIVGGIVLLLTHLGDVKTFFKNLPGWIATFFKGLGNIIVAPFKWAFNMIARGWDDTAGKLHFHIPKWIPGVGGKGFSMPQLPQWKATGGAVNAGKSYFVGERGIELFQPNVSGVIIPNDRLKPELNRQVHKVNAHQQQPSGQVNASVLHGGDDGGPITIQLVLDGKIVSETVLKNIRDKAARR